MAIARGDFALPIGSCGMFTCATGRNAGTRPRGINTSKGLHARLAFGCGCPIYAKLFNPASSPQDPAFRVQQLAREMGSGVIFNKLGRAPEPHHSDGECAGSPG